MSKLQISKNIETPILGKDGKPTKKSDIVTDIKIVHRVDFFETGSWKSQGYQIDAEAGMDFRKQRYGGSDE
tara:strand:- start:4038 stop:4250 length:213 start_codon:yes stop_codon:yes gene_type:complete